MRFLVVAVLFFLGIHSNAQNISNVGEIFSGSDWSYFLNSVVYEDEVYFIGPANSTSSFRAVYKYNDDTGAITKVISENTVFLTTHLMANQSSLYLTDSPFGERDLYRSQGSNSTTTLIKEFDDIDQKHILPNGVVIVDEINFNGDREVYYISNSGNEAYKFVDTVDIGFNDFVISGSGKYVFASPEDDDDFDGGSFFFDTDSKESKLASEVIQDTPCETLQQVRGFEGYIFYRCNAMSYLYDLSTSSSTEIDLPNSDIQMVEENEAYIFISYTFGRLYAISKNDLIANQIASDLATFPQFANTESSIYFVNNGNIEKHDGAQSSIFVYDLDDNDVVTGVQVINNIAHVLVERQFGLPDQIVALDEITNSGILLQEMRIDASAEYGFHKVNDNIIFAMRDDEIGQELFKLSYEPNNTNSQSLDRVNFTIAPNPVKDQIGINVEGLINKKSLNVQILNNIGNVLYEGSFENKIDVSELPLGTYFISVRQNNNGIWSRRFVKI